MVGEVVTRKLSREVANKVRGVVVAGYLSQDEKNAALERALECAGMVEGVPSKVAVISTEALAGVLDLALPLVSAAILEEIGCLLEKCLGARDEQRQALIAECKVCPVGEGKVLFTLPATMSRAEFLRQVQSVANGVYGQDAVYPPRLQQWATEDEFAEISSRDVIIAVNGCVNRSSYKSRDEQVSYLARQGLQMAEVRDLAVAHAAYFLAAGKDLFCGEVVRARSGALGFNCFWEGLYVSAHRDEERLGEIAASAYLLLG